MASAHGEVIYKGWLKKAHEPDSGAKKKSFLSRSSPSWKKRYVVLLRETEDGQDTAALAVFDKEVATNFDNPKIKLKLSPYYRVDKKYDPTGKQHVFEVKAPKATWKFMADSQTVMDLWVFYLQCQTKLRTDFPGKCFEVYPDDSESMRRIGARASQGLLHLSKWGITLASKVTRSLIAQWPLKSIREFESSETGRFSFRAGRGAPMGAGDYVFATLPAQDGEIYDLLDAYTTEDAGNQGNTQSGPATAEQINQDYERLRLATFGLLPRRGSEGRPTSPTLHSAAVPVPCRDSKTYDRLDRSRNGSNHRLDRSRSEQPKRTQPPPAIPARIPSLPTKAPRPPRPIPSLSQVPSLGQIPAPDQDPDYNLPYVDMGGEADTLPYTEMGAGVGSNTLTRHGLGRDSKDRMNWDVPIPRTLTNSTAASDRSSYQFMEFTPESYQNTLTDNYENAPLISESPDDDSELAGAVAHVSLADHSYQAVESGTLPANNSQEPSGPSSPLTHTYFEGNIGDLAGSSGERDHHYQGVYYEGGGAVGGDSLARSISVDNLRSPTITDFYFDRSPTLGSLDLAFSMSPTNMPDWMNSRQLPSLPRNEVPPTEENPYIMSPKQSQYAYEEVNDIFPPTPARTEQQAEYHSVINATPPRINTQGHTVRRGSQFSEGYVDSTQVTSYEDVDDAFRATTARIVKQGSVHQAQTAVVQSGGVTYTKISGTTTAADATPAGATPETDATATGDPEEKPEKRKSFTARTLERVKMKKSKSLVDISNVGQSPEKKSMALEDAPQTRKNSATFRRGMKKSQSNPDLLSDISSPTPQFSSPKRTLEKQSQSPVSGVRRKFGLGLKIMRNKSRSYDDEGELGVSPKGDKSKSSPKVAKKVADVKGISTTDKTISFTRRSQGQLQDLPLNSSASNRPPGLEDRRQRTVSSGSNASFHSVLNEQKTSTGMIANPLALDRQTSSASSVGPFPDHAELDEEGYLSPTDIGSHFKAGMESLEADMSGRPLPERPLPSPPAHSQAPPIISQSAPLMGAGKIDVSSEVYHV